MTKASPDSILQDLLNKDRFGLGFSPAQFISLVKLELDVQDSPRWPGSRYDYRAILGWIQCLHTLKKNARIDVRICQQGDIWSRYKLEAVHIDIGMSLVLPQLIGIRRAGYRVALQFGPSLVAGIEGVFAEWVQRFNHESEHGSQLSAE